MLFVYKTRCKIHQPQIFAGTNLNTCNTGSNYGRMLLATQSTFYFEVDAEKLHSGSSFEATLHYGFMFSSKMQFKNYRELIFFMEKLNPKTFPSIFGKN